ncbi:aspartate/glutamate racemase family protein [Bradyrhizobium sp. LHD-71]|uniref:aspartate/glutamate racemase family protein n=1 Tax=Bradyrhizobium sp. LHD-71 TaxID=3072141 RepID=UPI00280F50FB|nr:aspartate/glutamate racemase family protein [Bradyrhizobium sp. LHD-71]MDQ8728253.1 aspartate/glutamate racemase family protein [Bradyrhizobium sp. LHD-71]
MRSILLINPNSSAATTDMMVGIAQATAGQQCRVTGATARRAPAMIVDPVALEAAADEVLEIAAWNDGSYDGFLIAAFGDPGLSAIRARCRTPAAGIAECSICEAAADGRRFGIATTTPELRSAIDQRVMASGFARQYTGLRLTSADPIDLVNDRHRQREALAETVRRCIEDDGSQAVIIGGGPLGEAARDLQHVFAVPIISPIPAAMRSILNSL